MEFLMLSISKLTLRNLTIFSKKMRLPKCVLQIDKQTYPSTRNCSIVLRVCYLRENMRYSSAIVSDEKNIGSFYYFIYI